ncbi:hypothetical protein RHAL1_01268 [Beijerinckiaceae bacterium RH AL1]|nr:hypothetical protein [Beijerinckiaceae bacterium]VVB44472.1 hypothetical protein RHCH11_RHCH11_01242 [Beijerinckiaceae bacterium RH CH11]VVB44552.1 hypothetical protein RHAL8_01239 [Beijerinckiaceae bacterium RH AL8]VVC54371.1 hypothetical protein RHAL1_01268 [Beijerinckiaceae bacterium RH AL1]
MSLFHDDNHEYFNMERLEEAARDAMANCSLIQRCREGDRSAAIAHMRGFWPFTRDFEKAIDRRANSSNLPREPLYAKFGRNKTRETLLGSAKSIRNLLDSEIAGVFEEARASLIEMQKDEYRHSKHWEADARNLGISYEVLQSEPATPLIQRLIDETGNGDLVEFFARSLASTEFIAETAGETLAHAPAYTQLFARKRSIWMEVHTVPHDGEPSHEEIVMDFARAYDDSGSPERIEKLVLQGIAMFAAAADEVEAHYNHVLAVAAE